MIFNMTGDSGQVQIVKFTLDSDFNFSYPGLIINGVKKFPNGIHGFLVQPTGNFDTTEYNVIWLVATYSSQGVTQGQFSYIFASNSQFDDSDFHGNIDEYREFYYNSEQGTLTINVSLSNCFMKAGSYQLVIW